MRPFLGHYEHTLDAKDRLTVPAPYRADLSGDLVLAASLDPCVSIWPQPAFERFTREHLASLHPFSRDGQKVVRFFTANAFPAQLDSAHRVRIDAKLKQHAGLSGACALIGMRDHLQVWDADRWAEQEARDREQVPELAESLLATPER